MAKGLTRKEYRAAIARIYSGSKVIGAGFLVEEGYLLTCAHVVAAAISGISATTQAIPQETLRLDFLVAKTQMLSARVVFWNPVDPSVPHEDIAGLRLLEELPEGVKPIRLGGAESYWEHAFCSYGFPKKHKGGVWATGVLRDEVDDGRWIQMEDVKAPGYSIEGGFSGAPVFDEPEKKCVGMIVARDKDNEVAKVAFMIPYRILGVALKTLEALSLADILDSQLEGVQSHIEAAYQFCRPNGWNPEPKPTTLTAKLADVQRMPSGDRSVEMLYQFVAYLLQPDLQIPSAMRQSLRRWIEPRLDTLPALLDDVAQRSENWRQKQTEDKKTHLLIWVRAQRQLPGQYEVKALFIPDTDGYDPAAGVKSHKLSAPEKFGEKGQGVLAKDLPAIVEACLDESASYCYETHLAPAPDSRLTLELLLPIGLLNQAVDKWPEDDEADLIFSSPPIGCRHRLVVRSAERLEPSYLKYRGFWLSKWDVLLKCTQTLAGDALISGEGVSWRKLYGQLSQKKQALGIKLTQAPQSFGKGSVFSALLSAGAPTAIWLREALLGQNYQADMDQILGCHLCQVPETVQRQRINAFELEVDDPVGENEQAEENPHIGHQLSLLWENPNLVFPELPTQDHQASNPNPVSIES